MDTALKQRLVGASVLIALAVVVLPMILGGRPDGEAQQTQKIEVPSQPPELDFETRRYPIGEKAPDRDVTDTPAPAIALPVPEKPPPAAEQPASVDITAEDIAAEAVAAEAVAAEDGASELPLPETPATVDLVPLETPEEKVPASSAGGRYVVQVASFGAINNANNLSGTLGNYGYSVLLDTVKSDVGTLHRVRVGPYANETEANDAVARLQTQIKDIKPRVMDLQPEKSSPVSKPSDPLVRWVVQVGVFSNVGNADSLVARLRLESLSAYKEQVSRSGSITYRVRVGPFLDRDDAIKADKLINQRLSIDGVVMSAD